MRRGAMTAAAILVAVGIAACGGSEEQGTAPATQAEPPASAPSAGSAIPGGGLSVQEAIDSELDGPLMVKGFIVADGEDSVRLCSALAESLAPQCGEPSLTVEGLDLDAVDGLVRDEGDPGRTWTETEVSVLGDIENGAIAVSETSI